MTDDPVRDRLLEHSYDGIQEYDNPMPRWWVITFWATIVFAGVYLLDIGGLGVGKGRIATYEADMAAFRALHPAPRAFEAAALLARADRHDEVAAGQAIFAKSCAGCHAADGGGGIGPNLTDDYWLHGGRIEDIARTIAEGVQAKGMPAWGKAFTPEEVERLTGYIWSLHGTRAARPKAPQGELVTR